MKILLRIVSSGAVLMALAFLIYSAAGLYFAISRVDGRALGVSFLSACLAVLAVRCIGWLWASVPFWHSRQRRAEVGAFFVLTFTLPFAVEPERATEGFARIAVQASWILVGAITYLLLRYCTREKEEPNQAPEPTALLGRGSS